MTSNKADPETIKSLIFKRILIFLAVKPRTTSEVERRINLYLSKIKNSTSADKIQIKQTILEELKKSKFINDERYIAQYLRERLEGGSTESPIKMKNFLMKKGISPEIAGNAIKTIPTEYGTVKIKALAEKKLRTLLKSPLREKRQKTLTFILRKGFSYEQARAVVDTLLNVK